jgi:class 3 adenylate cyclase
MGIWQGMPQVTYELYAFDGARWSLQETFTGAQRERALDTAQRMYGESHITGVRVMQESYDADTGESIEKAILTRTKSDDVPKNLKKEIKQPKALDPPGKGPAPKPAKAKPVASKPVPGAPGKAAAAREGAKPAAVTRTDQAAEWARYNAGRLASVVAGSSIVAIGGGALMAQMPSDAHVMLAIKSVLGTQYILMIGIVLFGMGLAGFGSALLTSIGPGGTLHAVYAEQQAGSSGAPGDRSIPMPRFPVLELEEDEVEPPSSSGLPPEALRLIAFFHDCLEALPRDDVFMKNGKLDAHGWFGCHLFFAGLASQEGQRLGWPLLTVRQIIALAMTAALSDPRSASRFAARYDEYLTEPRYLEMFSRGSYAAMRRTDTDPSAAQALRLALDDWHRKQETGAASGHVAVMFTDIVGSTEFTTLHGDAKHYEMVQAHDRVVRAALQEFSGREIKHTGDGIMAAFDDATLSVQAALRIQREIRAHREVNPAIGMTLRLGISAGEPLKVGDDLFGSTVQLAARMCASADAEQIVITDPVREIAAHGGFAFVDLGERPVKGFKQPVRAHAVAEN